MESLGFLGVKVSRKKNQFVEKGSKRLKYVVTHVYLTKKTIENFINLRLKPNRGDN